MFTVGTPYVETELAAKLGPEAEVVAAMTLAVRGFNLGANARFWKQTQAVFRSLQAGEHEGLIGCAIRAQVLGRKSWTLSIWQDETALEAFSVSPVHLKAVNAGAAALRDAAFVRLRLRAREAPPNWRRITALLDERLKTT